MLSEFKHRLKNLITPIRNLRSRELDYNFIDQINFGRKKFLFSIPRDKCVLGVYERLGEHNPKIQSIKTGDFEYLKNYYRTFQPNSIDELLNISFKNRSYGSKIPHAYILPWIDSDPDQYLKRKKEVALEENLRFSNSKITLIKGGHTDFGPVSDRKLNIERQRYINLYNSIKNEGYKENPKAPDSGIKGYFLLGENDWRFMINGGKHRAYVLAAMEEDVLPVVVERKRGAIRMEKRDEWPMVKKGFYTGEEAVFVFKSFFLSESTTSRFL